MRKLASIKTVGQIIPIEGRDKIELAIIDGWSVIVKKDEFSVGSQCVYIEIDSILPEKEEFEFLRSKSFRIKTMKMAGVVSQGICFPMSILPKGNYKIEQDVTDVIGIHQYEKTMDSDAAQKDKKATSAKYPKWLMRIKPFRDWLYKRDHREAKGFPTFISKTDETRIQNAPFMLQNKNPFVATEKIDGQSGTFALVKKRKWFKEVFEYIVCSRNLRLWQKGSQSYWSVSDRYGVESVLRNIIEQKNVDWAAIQGECVAPNVQGNKYKVNKPDLYVFNVILPSGRLGSVEAKELVERFGLKFVPIVDSAFILPDTVQETLDYAHGQSAIGDTLREGIVFRSQDGKQSFKAVDPLFLLKYDE